MTGVLRTSASIVGANFLSTITPVQSVAATRLIGLSGLQNLNDR